MRTRGPGSEPTLAAGLPVPNKRLMAEPGVECLMDLLAKGANWLHDERDTYLPRSKARSPDGSAHIQGGCSRRFGEPHVQACRSGTSQAIATAAAVIAVTAALALAGRRCCRSVSGRKRKPG